MFLEKLFGGFRKKKELNKFEIRARIYEAYEKQAYSDVIFYSEKLDSLDDNDMTSYYYWLSALETIAETEDNPENTLHQIIEISERFRRRNSTSTIAYSFSAGAYSTLARMNEDEEYYNKALNDYTKLAELEPDARIWQQLKTDWLAEINRMRGDNPEYGDEVFEDIHQTIENPTYDLCFENLTTRFIENRTNKKYQDNIQLIESAIEKTSVTSQLKGLLSIAYSDAGEHAEDTELLRKALGIYDELLAIDPDDRINAFARLETLFSIAKLEQDIDLYHKIEDNCQRLTAKYPEEDLTYLLWAETQMEIAKIEGSIFTQKDSIKKKLDKAARLSDEEPAFLYARLYSLIGDSSMALQWLENELDSRDIDKNADLDDIINEPDFEFIRKKEQFNELLKKYNSDKE